MSVGVPARSLTGAVTGGRPVTVNESERSPKRPGSVRPLKVARAAAVRVGGALWGGAPTDPAITLGPVLHSYDGKGQGDFNTGRTKDPELDRLIEAADVEMDPGKRRALLVEALQRVRQQVYTIPLHRQVIPWAARKVVELGLQGFLEVVPLLLP